jgi:enoyl-CoA hydratase/carnithine racemase
VSASSVTVEVRGPVVLVGLDRPEKKNALDEAMVDDLHRVLDDHARAPTILIIHSTTPGIFAAGADIAELLERDADAALRAINAGLCEHLEAHRWPTIAAVDGWALGGGCELALACDLRVASGNARFGQPELNLGIMAGAGGNWRLAQLVGLAIARRMLYTGAILDAGAAREVGLVERVVPDTSLLDASVALAEEIATRSWRALELTKLALRLHRPATTTFDIVGQALLFESDDKRDRMRAFLERRERKSGEGGDR